MTGSKFISVMDKIGHDLEVAWADVVKYMPEASSLAAVLFPAQVATIGGVVNSVSLIQQAVATVEQKFAAMGKATGTGTQKLAQVTSMVGPLERKLVWLPEPNSSHTLASPASFSNRWSLDTRSALRRRPSEPRKLSLSPILTVVPETT